jgi:hypothetical protein
MLPEIAIFIASKTTFVIGTDLFYGFRRADDPDRCQVIQEPTGSPLIGQIKDRIDKTIQIISRAKEYQEASDDAWEIFNAIHGTFGWTLSGYLSAREYLCEVIEANSDPQYIGKDDNGRFEFSTNYIFKIQNKN